jgi:uncharacterized repeat protein (TIGR01451 family)
VYVAGVTYSSNFPLKAPIQSYTGRQYQKFVTTLSNSLDSISYYSTFFGTGGGAYDSGNFAIDKALNVYLTGASNGNVPVTTGALNKRDQGEDVFVSKLVIMDDLALGISASPSFSVKHGSNLTYTLAATSKGPDFGYNVRIDDPLPAGTSFVSFAASRGTCTAPVPLATGTLHCALQQLNKGDTFIVTLTVKVNAPSGTTLMNTATAVSNMQDFVPSNNKATFTSKVD